MRINYEPTSNNQAVLDENGYKHGKLLNDGRIAATHDFIFTCAIITMTPATMQHFYEDRWCYDTKDKAKAALEAWDGAGEPEGWHRHPGSGRRRENGDPLTEYVNP